jgi:flavin reductase
MANVSVSSDAFSLAADFKAAMRRLAAMVTIVTTEKGGIRYGMTATAVTSLSAEPPSLLACINRSASMHPFLRPDSRVCVNLLSSEHRALSDAFSGGMEPARRFETGSWMSDGAQTPYLADSTASLFGMIDHVFEYGSHSIIVVKIGQIKIGPGADPLIYHDGRYAVAS